VSGVRIPKGIQLTGESRRRIAARLRWDYERGATIRALAAASGRSYGSVRRLLTEAGAVMRPRGNDGNRGARQPPALSWFSP